MGQQKRESKLTDPTHCRPFAEQRDRASPEKSSQATTGPALPETGGRGEGKGAGSAPRTTAPTALQTGLQFLIKDLLRFWMVNIRREGHGETQGAGTRPAGVGTEAGVAEGRRRATPGESAAIKLLAACVALTGKAQKSRRSFLFWAFVDYPKAGTAPSAGHAPYRAARSLSSGDRESSTSPFP